MRECEELGELAEAALRKLSASKPSLEAHRSFEDTIDAACSWADIQAALSDDIEILFPEA